MKPQNCCGEQPTITIKEEFVVIFCEFCFNAMAAKDEETAFKMWNSMIAEEEYMNALEVVRADLLWGNKNDR